MGQHEERWLLYRQQDLASRRQQLPDSQSEGTGAITRYYIM